MGKPKIHIYCRDEMARVPLYVDGPVVRARFDVSRGPTIRPKTDLVIFQTSYTRSIKVKYPCAQFVCGFWPKGDTPRGVYKRIGVALRGARSVICASNFLARQIKAHFKVHNARVLPGGLWGTDHVKYKVNPERFKPKKHYRQHQAGPTVVMSISLASEIKWHGIDLLMEAAHEVFEDHGAKVVCRAMVRGRGDLVDKWLREYGLVFSQWRRAEGLTFTDGLGDEAWPKLLRRADLFIHPSTWDAWGCVVADAMFTAVPSLVFNGTGSAEISDVAIKVDPNDPGQIAGAVDRLLAMNPREREDYGLALRAEAIRKNEAHRQDIADAIEAVLEEL